MVFLILGVSVECASTGTCCTADGCAFKCISGLMADDATEDCTTETANDGSTLGIRAGWSRAVAERNGCSGRKEDECQFFHGVVLVGIK